MFNPALDNLDTMWVTFYPEIQLTVEEDDYDRAPQYKRAFLPPS
jgi:hypothetical protein